MSPGGRGGYLWVLAEEEIMMEAPEMTCFPLSQQGAACTFDQLVYNTVEQTKG